MTHKYSDAKNAQILIALLKAHNIHQIVINPGTTNIAIAGSVQYDPFFKVFSCVDERHAAYLACGLAAQSGESVVLSCTGATASRNYFPALTEAFYRKLPILAVTSMHNLEQAGQLLPQFLDRTVQPKDTVVLSVQCPAVNNSKDFSICELNINKAILALSRNGGGPVHINLETGANTFTTAKLPSVRAIHRHTIFSDTWPELTQETKIAVWVGAHNTFTKKQEDALMRFAATHNAVILTDCTSKYQGPYSLHSALVCSQEGIKSSSEYSQLKPDLLIHIGEICGDYPTDGFLHNIAPVWRVSPDGELRDRLGRLTNVFEMPEEVFFGHYAQDKKEIKNNFFKVWSQTDNNLRSQYPDLPFSNPWIAKQLNGKLPQNSVLHLGILNSLRSWNYYPAQQGVNTACNVGGFGIDGMLSTLIGASLADTKKLCFGVLGDLAFFYDLNALGNRHISNNLRILLVNNGCGGEFNMYNHPGSQFGKDTNLFIGAGGHFGKQSKSLVKHFSEDLGFDYLSACNKEEFTQNAEQFLATKTDKPIIFECFTNSEDESNALKLLNTIVPDTSLKGQLKKVLPVSVKTLIKKAIE